ncbi:MAG: MSMEG_0570 family nitrogen starvation response protein [Planctomycetota bacterium]
MPETYLHVEWGDRTKRSYYSPSTVVHQYLNPGETYPTDDFVEICRKAYQEASDRVKAKYGMACTGAATSFAKIESDAHQQAHSGPVTILTDIDVNIG